MYIHATTQRPFPFSPNDATSLPRKVMQAMRQQGLNALPLELKRKPWASVVLHTKLEPWM